MNIREVFEIINEMQADRVIDSYAVGGAVGATFYLEPVATLDVDIFVSFPTEPESLITTPAPIFEYLTARGGAMEREYIVVAGTPVQFLLSNSPLIQEALRDAVEKDVEGVPLRVLTAEHLAAIALQTGRAKDKTRLAQFLEENALDLPMFLNILARHDLNEKWRTFERRFLEE